MKRPKGNKSVLLPDKIKGEIYTNIHKYTRVDK